FPRWNCWVKDPLLARSLANEIQLFLPSSNAPALKSSEAPAVWMVAHSNGAVIALLATGLLIERGYAIEGLILTGAACESDIEGSGILDWQSRGMLGVAIAYSSRDDQVLEELTSETSSIVTNRFSRMGRLLWRKLIWPYGSLGRTGWTLEGKPLFRDNLI